MSFLVMIMMASHVLDQTPISHLIPWHFQKMIVFQVLAANSPAVALVTAIGRNGRALYMTTNYGAPVVPGLTATTRYGIYKQEVALAGGAGSNTPILTGRSETGRSQCSNSVIEDVERRVFVAAGIDCTANSIQGVSHRCSRRGIFQNIPHKTQ